MAKKMRGVDGLTYNAGDGGDYTLPVKKSWMGGNPAQTGAARSVLNEALNRARTSDGARSPGKKLIPGGVAGRGMRKKGGW